MLDRTIQNVASKLFLTDANASSAVGIQVVQSHPLNDDTQLWSLISSGVGFAIRNNATGLALDDSGFTLARGLFIVLWPLNGGMNQAWSFE